MTKAPIDATLVTLNDIVKSVSYAVEAGTIREVLARIAEAARELVAANYVALGVPDGQGGLKYFETAGLSQEEIALIPHQPTGRGLLGVIMREQRVIRLEDMQEHERSSGVPEGHPDMTTFLGVPIQIGSTLLGMLYLSDRKDGLPFDDHDQRLVETIAGYAALAIAGAELSDQQQQMALFEERERIAMDMHDSIIQDLYAIGMHVDLIRRANSSLSDGLAEVVNSLNQVIDDIRSYIMDLRAKSYEQQTVKACFEEMVARMHISAGQAVIIDVEDSRPPISAITFEAVCQIVNEAVSNSVRHADAETITITSRQTEQWYHLRVDDDGIGFNEHDETLRLGMGLRNIRKRARLHGGEVTINTIPGRGTSVIITVPALP